MELCHREVALLDEALESHIAHLGRVGGLADRVRELRGLRKRVVNERNRLVNIGAL